MVERLDDCWGHHVVDLMAWTKVAIEAAVRDD